SLALNPDFDEARFRLVQCLLAMNVVDEARPHLQLLVERRPQDPGVLLGLARCAHARGAIQETEQFLPRLPPGTSDRGPGLLEPGKLALEAGRLQEAEKLLRQALSYAPYEPQVLYALAQCLRQRGEKTESDVLLARFERISADWKRFRSLTEKMHYESHSP